MTDKTAEWLNALPSEETSPGAEDADERLREVLARLAQRPVPVSSLRRLWSLGSLPAGLAAGYTAQWLRGWFENADAKERRRIETHLRAALLVFERMGYLRGLIMKVGQALAAFPEFAKVPAEFAELLGKLHFEAPPMHYALLREHVRNELGQDPEELFDSFETTACAAASLGQVHRARLKSGQRVAVKIQYPGIAQTIAADFRNLGLALFPLRLSREWENLRDQFDEIRRMLEQETDYVQEAGFLKKARTLFRPEDGIVIPRVYEEFSTRRVLTMEYLDGVHLDTFLAGHPSQELRDAYGEKINSAAFRMCYSGRMDYGDPHPGNYLFMDDGKLGIIDFGCMRAYSDEEWDQFRAVSEGYAPPSQRATERFAQALADAAGFTDRHRTDKAHMMFLVDMCGWVWEPFEREVFDFGNAEHLRKGIDLFAQTVRKRYTRGRPMWIWLNRAILGVRAILFRLGARVNTRAISERELQVTGWRLQKLTDDRN